MRSAMFLAATALTGAIFLAPAAMAQSTATTSNPPAASENPELQDQTGVRPEREARDTANTTDDTAIVVTGSRLARPAIESPVPITSITADELLAGSNQFIGDQLNDLPALRATYSQANSTRFIGTTGLNLLDLRGLGVSRTLVLVNGRRHVPSLPGGSLIDTNTIPNDLLDRTDIVTGGNSAVYGSDAIAGVVNFVLKQDFDGLRLNGQGSVSQYGDRGNAYLSGVFGKNFDEGRGNMAVAVEYSHAGAIYYRDRDFETGAYSGRNQFNGVDNTADDGATGSDGIVDNAFFRGVRNGTISTGGILNAVCVIGTIQTTATRTCRPSTSEFVRYYGRNQSQANNTAYLGQRYGFDESGNLVLSNPTIDFRDLTGTGTNTVGGLGSTLYETGQIIPRSDRISFNALGHYDFSDAFTVYYEGKYVNIYQNQEGQPSFFQNGVIALNGANAPLTRCNNPYLTAANLATLQSIGYCAAGATSTATIPIGRFNVDFGGRGELFKRETFRFLGGARGTFNDDWKYDVSVIYGEQNNRLRSLNNLIVQRFVNSANAVRNAAGQIVCGINADASTANDDASCVPVNLFGYQRPSQAALNYFNTTTNRYGFANQFDVNGYVSGDLSQLFEMPGGPIGFVLGGEYRRERSYQYYDEIVRSGQTFLNAIQPFVPPVLEVKEAFGEINIPIVKDVFALKELSIGGAARVSDYNNSAGTVWAYSGNVLWAPISEVRFRANYARSVRVPTQSDLFSPLSQNFAQLADPCDIANRNTGQFRATNCAAAGIPANFINTPARTASTSFLSGGNPFLTAETSDSYTVGAVFQPTSLVPGLSVTIDYYNITVNNLIATLGAQTVLNQCYDSPGGINNQYCALISRNADFTFTVPNGIISAGVNFAKQKTSGIDIDYAYAHTFGNGDKLGLSLLASWVAERTNFVNPLDPTFADRQLSELGDPQWEFNATANYTTGPVSFRYNVQYIGPMVFGGAAYETLNDFDGRPATNPDAFDRYWYDPVTYHNVRVGLNVNEGFNFYFGVDNIGNKLPPFGLFGNGGGDSIYDAIGRTFYAGFRAKF